jgi:hypothetical protein
MNKIFRYFTTTVIALAVVSPMIDEVTARDHPLDENAALALLERTLKHDGIYTHRISLDCVTYGTEEKTAAYFQFVLRENHTAECGGDPETSPVVDRYRVYRASGKIEWLEKIEGNWQPYNPAKIK